MADLSDVTATLAQLASAALYPNGPAQPGVAGVTVTCAGGWPEPKQLDAILAAGNAMLTVFPLEGSDANTTRFPPTMLPVTRVPPSNLRLTAAGNQVTVGGVIASGEAACVRVNYAPYSLGIQASDTLVSFAAALAELIPGAAAVGTVVTIPGAFDLGARVSVPVRMQQEVARQTRVFALTAWCATPATRDAIASAVDLCLKSMKRIVLPDNTWARLIYRGTFETDTLAKQCIYRRDLRYEVEYATTVSEMANTVVDFAVVAGLNSVAGGGGIFTVNL